MVQVRLGDLSLNRTWACQPRYFHTCLSCRQDLVHRCIRVVKQSKQARERAGHAGQTETTFPLRSLALCEKLTNSKGCCRRELTCNTINQTLRVSLVPAQQHTSIISARPSSSDIIALCTNKRFSLHQTTPRGWAQNQITPPITRAFTTRSQASPEFACQQIGARRSADG